MSCACECVEDGLLDMQLSKCASAEQPGPAPPACKTDGGEPLLANDQIALERRSTPGPQVAQRVGPLSSRPMILAALQQLYGDGPMAMTPSGDPWNWPPWATASAEPPGPTRLPG